MNEIDLRTVDLNLLVVFQAIHEEGSLTRAGKRLGLTQPAVSHALRHLRSLYSDPLFIRTREGVQPSAVAERVANPIRNALVLIESSLRRSNVFRPGAETRTFKLSMSDMGEFVYMPPLLDRISREAPDVTLDARPIDIDRLPDALRDGEIDLAIGYLPGLGNLTKHETLFRDHHVCLVRAEHPMRAKKMTSAAFSKLHHVSVSSTSSGHRMIEDLLVEYGIRRRIALRLTHLSVIPQVIERTDLAATLPYAIAKIFAKKGQFRIYEHPVKLPPIDVTVHWHARFDDDPAVRWLRTLVFDVLSGIQEQL